MNSQETFIAEVQDLNRTTIPKEIVELQPSKEYEQYAIAKRPPDDIGRIYLGLGSNPDKRYGYWIGRMVQRDYQDAEVVCAKRESRLATLDELQNLFREKGFIEKLADLEHDRWSRWELYRKRITDRDLNKFNQSVIEGWERKSNQTYSELTEAERESDRVEARKTLALLLVELEALRKKVE